MPSQPGSPIETSTPPGSPLHCLHVYSGNLYGGVERLLVTIARRAAACPEMESAFALCFPGRLSGELIQSGADVELLGGVRLSRPWTVRAARSRLENLLRREPPSVAVFHAEWPLAVFGRVARQAGIPVVLWIHNFFQRLTWLHRLARKVTPDLMICSSRAVTATVSGLFADVPAACVHYPVWLPALSCSTETRNQVRHELATPPAATVIVQTSRMEPCKGHRLHLEALAHLRHVPGWVCWLVGGAQRPEEVAYVRKLRAYAGRAGISDRVRFVGERSDVMRVLQAADIHCQPNWDPESFGIAFIEALHAGLPVVTTAIGGALEIVDERCGILVPPKNSAALREALKRLIANPGLRRALGKAGPERAARLCDAARQLNRLHQLLSAVARPEPCSAQPEASAA